MPKSKEFTYAPPNQFAKKQYIVTEGANNYNTIIEVTSPFLGNWKFDLNLNYTVVFTQMADYCSGELVQNAFAMLTPETREKLMTPPSMWSEFDN